MFKSAGETQENCHDGDYAAFGDSFMAMHNKKVVIFDLDGTLVGAYKAIARSFNYAMLKLNYPKQPPVVIRKAVGWGDEKLLGPFVKRADLKKALIIYRRQQKRDLIRYSRLLLGSTRRCSSKRSVKKTGYLFVE